MIDIHWTVATAEYRANFFSMWFFFFCYLKSKIVWSTAPKGLSSKGLHVVMYLWSGDLAKYLFLPEKMYKLAFMQGTIISEEIPFLVAAKIIKSSLYCCCCQIWRIVCHHKTRKLIFVRPYSRTSLFSAALRAAHMLEGPTEVVVRPEATQKESIKIPVWQHCWE